MVLTLLLTNPSLVFRGMYSDQFAELGKGKKSVPIKRGGKNQPGERRLEGDKGKNRGKTGKRGKQWEKEGSREKKREKEGSRGKKREVEVKRGKEREKEVIRGIMDFSDLHYSSMILANKNGIAQV